MGRKANPMCKTHMARKLKTIKSRLFSRAQTAQKVWLSEEELEYLKEYVALHRPESVRGGIKSAYVRNDPTFPYYSPQYVIVFEDGDEKVVGLNDCSDLVYVHRQCRNTPHLEIYKNVIPPYCEGEPMLAKVQNRPIEKIPLSADYEIHHQRPRFEEIVNRWVSINSNIDLSGDHGKFSSDATIQSFVDFHTRYARIKYVNPDTHKKLHEAIRILPPFPPYNWNKKEVEL
jgi:hypothetical protein